MINICIISNSNLGAFLKYLNIFQNKKYNFLVITSKKKKFINKKNLFFIHLCDKNNKLFNKKATLLCKKFKPNKVILFYTKKIESSIFDEFKTINIHNSLLPNYSGLNSLKKSFLNGNKLICSTAHAVNQKFDSGKILFQISTPAKLNKLSYFKKIAFYHRIILFHGILIANNKRKKYSVINNNSIISPGLDKINIKFNFWN
jgi:folate-dependent phosphoribosylglycinamide formyltransferase PurN